MISVLPIAAVAGTDDVVLGVGRLRVGSVGAGITGTTRVNSRRVRPPITLRELT